MRRTLLAVLSVPVLIAALATPALAQKSGATPYRLHQTKMSVVERQLNHVAARIQSATAALEGLGSGAADPQSSALRDILARTTELHDYLLQLERNRGLMDSWGGMESYKSAAKDLEKTSNALESLTRHLVEVKKAEARASR